MIHKLRQLRRAKELFDGRHNGANIDEGIRCNIIGILRRHALTNHTLHTAHTNTELILNKLAYGAHTTVTKVIDVIEMLCLITCMNRKQELKSGDNIFIG